MQLTYWYFLANNQPSDSIWSEPATISSLLPLGFAITHLCIGVLEQFYWPCIGRKATLHANHYFASSVRDISSFWPFQSYLQVRIRPENQSGRQGENPSSGKEQSREARAGSEFGKRLLEEAMQEREARIEGCCEVGKDCCALRILEAQPDSATEQPLLETAILEARREVIFHISSYTAGSTLPNTTGGYTRKCLDDCRSNLKDNTAICGGQCYISRVRRRSNVNI